MSAAVGTVVTSGQLLFDLDDTEIEINIKSAENILLAAQTALKNYDSDSSIQTQLDTLKKQLDKAQKELNSKITDKSNLELKSEIDGTITRINYAVNDQVSKDSVDIGIQVTKPKEFVVNTLVNESDMPYIKKGLSAKLVFSSMNNKSYEAEIINFSAKPLANDASVLNNGSSYGTPNVTQKQYSVTLGFKKIDDYITEGMTAQVLIETYSIQNVLVVPITALKYFPQEGSLKVQLQEGNTYKLQEVEIGVYNDEFAEIKTGLNENDVILLQTADPAPIIQNNFGG